MLDRTFFTSSCSNCFIARSYYYFQAVQFLLNCFTYTPNLVIYDVKPSKLCILYSTVVDDLTIFPFEPNNYLLAPAVPIPEFQKALTAFQVTC